LLPIKFEILKGNMPKNTLSIFILIINSFSWYFPLNSFFMNSLYKIGIEYSGLLVIFGVHYITILLFAILGTTLVKNVIRRDALLSVWMLLGTISSACMIFLQNSNLSSTCLISFLIGMSLGFGYPSCLAYFADSVSIEKRGRIGGIIFSIALLGIFLIGLLTTILSFFESVLIFALWRAAGFIAFQTTKAKKTTFGEKKVDISYNSILSEKPFILYMIPWIMFCLVNFFAVPIFQHYWGGTLNLIMTTEFGIASIASLIGGYFADLYGRKRLIILSYILLGMGYAALSIFPNNNIVVGIYTIFDGIAWGLFMLIFFMIVWGDLAGNKAKDKYYLLGETPFLMSSYLSVIVTPYAGIIPISSSFSLASFFLFLAVIPLMYAPETLPEKEIRRRELKKYIEEAKRIREKYEER